MSQKWSDIVAKLCGKDVGAQVVAEETQSLSANNSESTSPLHALIIGINDYISPDITKLRGAVNDAQAFKDYLTKDLSVPEENITTLFDAQATRAGIIEGIQGLSKNDNIKPDDPIVIYYSGHGAEIAPPPDRAINGPVVQCVIPRDASTKEGARVCPIPDFTISALLDDLAKAKGNNVTVIFDCCHSAGGSRDGDDEGSRFVEMQKLPPLPAEIDSEIVNDKSLGAESEIDAGFAKQAMNSHTLIAACAHGERAYENGDLNRGYFTLALLELLRRVKVDSLTYKGCMQRLPTLGSKNPQNPVCEGQNIGRIFFNAKVAGSDSSFILVKTEGTAHYLQAGLAEGITPGSTFAIHANDVLGPNNPSLGTLVVYDTDPFQVQLHLPDGAAPFDVPELAYARQIGYGSEQALDVYFTEDFVNSAKPSPKWKSLFSGSQRDLVIRPADQAVAQLTLGISENKQHATFTIANQAAVKYGIQDLKPPKPIPAEADYILPILRATSLWSWHLRRTNGEHPFQSAVEVQFFKLKKSTFTSQGNQVFEPVGENLNIGGEVDIVIKEGDFYGLKIINNSSRDLYSYPIYFSVSDQSISPIYNYVCGNGKVDPSLPQDLTPDDPTKPKGNYVTVGYGSGGVRPLKHMLREGDDIDVGIYKIFLTTSPSDFSSLKLDSPLNLTRALAADTEVRDSLGNLPMWDTIPITVVQRRHPKVPGLESGEALLTKAVATTALLDLQYTTPLKFQAVSDKVKSINWFRTDPLTEEQLSKATHMRLRTRSQETPGSKQPPTPETKCTWFEISIIADDGAPKVGEDEEPLVWESHKNERGAELGWVEGLDFDRGHDIWGHLQPGDSLEIVANAKYRGWANDAREASLFIW